MAPHLSEIRSFIRKFLS